MDQKYKDIVSKARKVLSDSKKLTEATGLEMTSFNVVLLDIIALADHVAEMEEQSSRADLAVAEANRLANEAQAMFEVRLRSLDDVLNRSREQSRKAFKQIEK